MLNYKIYQLLKSLFLFFLISLLLPIILFIVPTNVQAISTNIDISNAQSSVGKRFAEVYCEAITEGLDSGFASEYALNNTYLKFVAFPDDEEYLDDLWQFTSNKISEKWKGSGLLYPQH